MPFTGFDRNKLIVKKLSDRKDKLSIEKIKVSVTDKPRALTDESQRLIGLTADKIRKARSMNSSVMLTFGAHTIKNGLGPVLIALLEDGWLTHLATNGAGIIHDWEFAYQGTSGEDVRENTKNGQFGIWEETGRFINLAIISGAYEGLGYGESVGKMISDEGIHIPDPEFLMTEACNTVDKNPRQAAAAIEMLAVIKKQNLKPGFISIPHKYKKYSVQCSAFVKKIPFTGHPMFGHDIIYTHPMNNGASIGRTAEKDFLTFAESVCNIENGVYMSVGSSVMSPMVFEKSLSMAQNVKIQDNSHIDNHFIIVVDLEKTQWDWQKDGEPPQDNPAYYLRYCKTFNRMGGEMHYLSADNRDFLLELYRQLSA